MPIDKIFIRRALPGDIDEVLTVEADGAAAWTRSQFAEELNYAFSEFLVAECPGEIAGFSVAWRVADEIQLNYIAIRNRCRRRGIGRALIEHMIRIHVPGGARKMVLEIRAGNVPGFLFYRSLGFLETGLRKSYYGDEDALLMEKNLL